jgi:recombination DNA repair RAD52 pathway protein
MNSIAISFILGGCMGVAVMTILFVNAFIRDEKIINEQNKKIKKQEKQNIKFAETIEQIAKEIENVIDEEIEGEDYGREKEDIQLW